MVTTTASSSSTNLTNILGAGSGIDIKTLAQRLVDAEKAPRKAAIDKGVSNSEKVVSGMAAVKYALTNLQTAFDNLKDKSDFKTLSLSNSQTSAFTATASTAADAGSHTVLVNALAAAQRNTGTTAFATTGSAINGGAAITLTLGGSGFSGGGTITIAAGNDTPAGVVAAINGAGKGLSAQLVNTGDATSPYKVVVTGSTGSSNAFTISSSAAGINFDSTLQQATNASVTVNGIAISSKSNTLSEAIPGVTLNLLATNTSAASLNLRNDTSGAKTKVLALVTAYNDAMTMLNELTNPKSTLETYGATLSGNSTVTNLRSQLRALVTADSSTATSSGGLAALRDIGIEVDKTGKLTSNSVKLDLALDLNFSNTAMLLSGNQENQSSFDPTPSGLAGDASKAITQLISSSGAVATESANATTRISKYKDDLVKLEDRMTRVLARYNKQFATMDSMVGQTKSTQTGLTSSFAGLMAMYTNK